MNETNAITECSSNTTTATIPTKLKYRLGLDLGIASVGWCVIETDESNNPIRVIDLGSHIFEKAETPKGGSLAGERRSGRSMRRVIRRRLHRRKRVCDLLWNNRITEKHLEKEDIDTLFRSLNTEINELRYSALERLLTPDEFCAILLHFVKRRGFKSNRKSEMTITKKDTDTDTEKDDKEEEKEKVLFAIEKNRKQLEESGLRTLGEMIYKSEETHFTEVTTSGRVIERFQTRNGKGEYGHTVFRSLLEDEIKIIFECQRKSGNAYATEKLEKEYLDIFTGQRSFDKGPGNAPDGSPSPYGGDLIVKMRGKCTLESDEPRCSKAAPSGEWFIAIQRVNNMNIRTKDGMRRVTQEERLKLIEMMKQLKYSGKITCGHVLKALGLDKLDDIEIVGANLRKSNWKRDTFLKMESTYKLCKILHVDHLNMDDAKLLNRLDMVADVLTLYKEDLTRLKKLEEISEAYGFPLSEEEKSNLLELSFDKFLNLSLKAIRKLNPFLTAGMTYDKACSAAGYDFRGIQAGEKHKYLNVPEVLDAVAEIRNPVVKRTIYRTIRIMNAIIKRYGSPNAIYIELAREMSKTFKERKEIEARNQDNQKVNDTAKIELQEWLSDNSSNAFRTVKGQDIVKYKLWQEQGEVCMYSGRKIKLEDLFDDTVVQVDHIIPYSISFDDTYANKVLVFTEENQNKGNQTPYEYLGSDEQRWHELEVRAETLHNKRKQSNILAKTLPDIADFKQRNLTDTSYIAKFMKNLIERYLYLEPYENEVPEKVKQHVFSVNGAITAYLRKMWGFPIKDRNLHIHHALDAAVIGCCSPGMIRGISKHMQWKEGKYSKNFRLVDEETGEIFTSENTSRDKFTQMCGIKFPLPWKNFHRELDLRMCDNPEAFREEFRKMGYPEYIVLRPIPVTKLVKHKQTGTVHADTLRSPKYRDSDGVLVTKTPLSKLTIKVTEDPVLLERGHKIEVVNYFRKETDWLLYDALIERIESYLHDDYSKKGIKKAIKEAFEDPFYKPKHNGKPGNIVKTVKIATDQTRGVLLNNGKAIAQSVPGSMRRVDIFRVNGKYYMIPIYIKDTVNKRLPNVVALSSEKNMLVSDIDFVFSLYPGDLIYIKSKRNIKLKGQNPINDEEVSEAMFRYVKMDTSTNSITLSAIRNNCMVRGVGIQSLLVFDKYEEDILGYNLKVVKKEKRIEF